MVERGKGGNVGEWGKGEGGRGANMGSEKMGENIGWENSCKSCVAMQKGVIGGSL